MCLAMQRQGRACVCSFVADVSAMYLIKIAWIKAKSLKAARERKNCKTLYAPPRAAAHT